VQDGLREAVEGGLSSSFHIFLLNEHAGQTTVRGAKVVARAWIDPAFRQRLLSDAASACAKLGFTSAKDTALVALEVPSHRSRSGPVRAVSIVVWGRPSRRRSVCSEKAGCEN